MPIIESKVDKLKERLSYFVNESISKTSLKIPNRIVQGFKLDNVAVAIQDLLCDKHKIKLKYTGYEQIGNDFIYNYIEI